jgi:outer membrane protein W
MKVNFEYNEDGDVETVEMAGSGISAKILADFNFNPYFGVRATSGLEQFNVYGEGEEEVCDDQSDTKCSTEISFLTLDAVLRFIFVPGTFAPWAGAGFTLLFPSGSSTTALDEASITTTWAGLISLGFDLSLGKMAYVPFQFDYALFNNSENVATDLMALRLGVGFKF